MMGQRRRRTATSERSSEERSATTPPRGPTSPHDPRNLPETTMRGGDPSRTRADPGAGTPALCIGEDVPRPVIRRAPAEYHASPTSARQDVAVRQGRVPDRAVGHRAPGRPGAGRRARVSMTIRVALLVDSPSRRAHGNAVSRLALRLAGTGEGAGDPGCHR